VKCSINVVVNVILAGTPMARSQATVKETTEKRKVLFRMNSVHCIWK